MSGFCKRDFLLSIVTAQLALSCYAMDSNALHAAPASFTEIIDWKSFDPATYTGPKQTLVPITGSKYLVSPRFPNDPVVNGIISTRINKQDYPVIVYAHEGSNLFVSAGTSQIIQFIAPKAGKSSVVRRGNGLPACTIYGTTDYTSINYGTTDLSKVFGVGNVELCDKSSSNSAISKTYLDLNRMFFEVSNSPLPLNQSSFPRLVYLKTGESLHILKSNGQAEQFISSPEKYSSTWQSVLTVYDNRKLPHSLVLKQLPPSAFIPGRISGTDNGIVSIKNTSTSIAAQTSMPTGNRPGSNQVNTAASQARANQTKSAMKNSAQKGMVDLAFLSKVAADKAIADVVTAARIAAQNAAEQNENHAEAQAAAAKAAAANHNVLADNKIALQKANALKTALSASGASGQSQALAGIPALNVNLLKLAFQQIGKKIGNGQCTTFVSAALTSVGARLPGGYSWGRRLEIGEEWKPGDVVQFTSCRFERRSANSFYYWILGIPNHTAIIAAIQNGSVVLLHQNVSPDQKVQMDTYNFAELVSGGLEVYRPQ